MSSSLLDAGQQADRQVSASAPASNHTDDENPLLHSMRHLSLATASATALPPSPQISPGSKPPGQRSYPSSPNPNRPPRSPVNRSSSAMSARSSTPTLMRKTSMNSLRGNNGTSSPRQSGSRRTSAQFGQPSLPFMGKTSLPSMDEAPPAPVHTSASIASAHFKTELALHDGDPEVRPADTIVILHDSCYGHRYSRPRTSRAGLNTIVERPERIQASVLGISAAYVRLGERHAEGRHGPTPKKDASHIPTIPFRIRKTTRKLPLSSQAVTNVHGTKWMEELKIMCDTAEAKLATNGKELIRPDMPRSPEAEVPAEFHEGDLYLCSESLEAMEGALGAVCEGVDAVFNGAASQQGPHRAFVTIRPPGHHCSASYPSGFCWLNNVHVGIAHAALNHGLTHAAIIDFDLHHGDGSQAIAWEQNTRGFNLPRNAAAWKKTSIGYFSLHDINSYPCEAGDEEKVKNASLCIENAHGQTIWNVHLQEWKTEAEFWDLYQTKYLVLLEKCRDFLRNQAERIRATSGANGSKPKAAIFLSAGFDASEWESSGMQRHKVNVPTDFYAKLARDVVKLAAEEDGVVEGRIISVLEGGYSDNALTSGVLSHISGLAGSDPVPVKRENHQNGLGYEMSQKPGVLDETIPKGLLPESDHEYDPTWWACSQLEALDAVARPPAPAPEPKKPRTSNASTYFSPTQSSAAKKVSTPIVRRTTSNMSMRSNGNDGSPYNIQRPRSPPPPEVFWTTAAHELSKLLIPKDRPTASCKPEELSAEATKARRDRQSILSPQAQIEPAPQASSAAGTRMALRGRKPAKPTEAIEKKEGLQKPVPKAGRRKTVAGTAVIAAEKAVSQSTTPKPESTYTQPTQTSSRRLSLTSNAGSVSSQFQPPIADVVDNNSRPTSSSTFQRSGSSQSIRPGSSMSSVVPPVPSLTVKKTRPVASSSKAVKAPKKSPAVEGKVKPVVGENEAHSRPPLAKKTPSTKDSASPSTAIAEQDMDSLTSGMKKVKITLTTKAQREAREQARIAAEEAASEAAPEVPPTPQPEVVPTVSEPLAPQISSPNKLMAVARSEPVQAAMPIHEVTPPTPEIPASSASPESVVSEQLPLSSAPQLPSTPQHTQITQVQQASNMPLPSSSPIAPLVPPSVPSPPISTAATATIGGTNVFIPYQPEGPSLMALGKQEPPQQLQWLEPNSGTPAAPRNERPDLPTLDGIGGSRNGVETNRSLSRPGKKDLPVFNATGAIPFAPIAAVKVDEGWNRPGMDTTGKYANVNEVEEVGDKKQDMWAYPETPVKQ